MYSLPMPALWAELLSGVISGIVFCILYTVPLLLYLPSFILMLCGLCHGAASMRRACFIACFTILLLLGLQSAAFFGLVIALPSSFLVNRALLWRGERPVQWFPAERILAEMTVGIAAFFMAFALMVAPSGPDGLETLAIKSFGETAPSTDPQTAGDMMEMATRWSFAFFSFAGWMWVLLIYGFAALATMFLRRRGMALRPRLALSWRGLPLWLHLLLGLCLLLACVGTGNDRYCARMESLLLLLPYVLAIAAKLFSFRQNA